MDPNKEFVLCINKADYLSKHLIEHWNKYFIEKNINHFFFSAKIEQNKLDQAVDEEESSEDEDILKEEEKNFEPILDDLKKEIEHDQDK